MPRDRYEQFTMGADGKPTLLVHRYDGTGDEKYTGDKALAWASNPYAAKWRRLNPVLARNNRIEPGDVRGGIPYRLGAWVKGLSESPGTSFMGSLFDKGMTHGGVAGAIMGGLGGLGGRFLYNKFFGDGESDPNYLLYTLLGAAGGGALGAGLSYSRDYARNNATPEISTGSSREAFETSERRTPAIPEQAPQTMYKSSSIYKDPRNYILERIQTAKDILPATKVKLANAVLELSEEEAEPLSKVVRECLGTNIEGAITNYLYGGRAIGSYYSRILSLLGRAYLDRCLQ